MNRSLLVYRVFARDRLLADQYVILAFLIYVNPPHVMSKMGWSIHLFLSFGTKIAQEHDQ